MKKLFILTISLIAIGSSFLMIQPETHSNNGLPYPNPDESINPSPCLARVANEVVTMRDAWHKNLKDLKAQEKAPSEKVDEAFESMRTYRCWLDYLCESVLKSTDIETIKDENGNLYYPDQDNVPFDNVDFLARQIDTLPGCAPALDLDGLDYLISGNPGGTLISYLDQCYVPISVNSRSAVSHLNYLDCRSLVELEFTEGEVTDKSNFSATSAETFKDSSSAFQTVERMLKSDSADSTSRGLKKKLSSIITKMHALESHVETLKQHMFKFDAMLPCYAGQCD